MATTVTGLTAARMAEMEAATVIDGNVVGNNLILVTKGGTTINTGNVRGPMGSTGSGHVICTSTTRPAAVLGDEGLTIYETDTNLVRTWTGSRWKIQEIVICTSTTRPASLVTTDEGLQIYELDTNRRYAWDGTNWFLLSIPTFASASARSSAVPSPGLGLATVLQDTGGFEIFTNKTSPSSWRRPWNMPWGIMRMPTALTPDSSITPGDQWVAGFPTPWIPSPGTLDNRVLRAVCSLTVARSISPSSDLTLSCQRASTVSERLFQSRASVGNTTGAVFRLTFQCEAVFTTTANNQVGGFIFEPTATVALENGAWWVEDLGPG